MACQSGGSANSENILKTHEKISSNWLVNTRADVDRSNLDMWHNLNVQQFMGLVGSTWGIIYIYMDGQFGLRSIKV